MLGWCPVLVYGWPWSVSWTMVSAATSSVRLSYWALSIHWPPHHRRRSITVGLPQQPSTPLTQLCFFQSISIDTQRRRDNEKKTVSTKRQTMSYRAGCVRLTEQTYRSSRTVSLSRSQPMNARCRSSVDRNYRLFYWCRISAITRSASVRSPLNATVTADCLRTEQNNSQ